jgi:hypothetical protein
VKTEAHTLLFSAPDGDIRTGSRSVRLYTPEKDNSVSIAKTARRVPVAVNWEFAGVYSLY